MALAEFTYQTFPFFSTSPSPSRRSGNKRAAEWICAARERERKKQSRHLNFELSLLLLLPLYDSITVLRAGQTLKCPHARRGLHCSLLSASCARCASCASLFFLLCLDALKRRGMLLEIQFGDRFEARLKSCNSFLCHSNKRFYAFPAGCCCCCCVRATHAHLIQEARSHQKSIYDVLNCAESPLLRRAWMQRQLYRAAY